jgi:DeoR family transcriptional regulator, fructose operon transcriptional repressor
MLSLKATFRHEFIQNALRTNGSVKIRELTEHFGVSAVTIREDLKYLEKRNLLRRTRGGAVSAKPNGIEMPLEYTTKTMHAEKVAIGKRAAALVENGQAVIIDVGSTTTQLAKALSFELAGVTAITNGLNIALSLESIPGLTVVVTGGTLRPLQHSLVSPMGTVLLQRLNADIAFIGCNGVHVERGITNTNIAEAEIKQIMMASASYVVILADSRKLGAVASASVAGIDAVDLLITDAGADPQILKELRSTGLETDIVQPAEGVATQAD